MKGTLSAAWRNCPRTRSLTRPTLAPAGPFELTEASDGDSSESGSNGEVTLEAEDDVRDTIEDGEIEPGEDQDSGAPDEE